MNDTQVIDILKKAIVLEQQGQSFYKKVADQTERDRKSTRLNSSHYS